MSHKLWSSNTSGKGVWDYNQAFKEKHFKYHFWENYGIQTICGDG